MGGEKDLSVILKSVEFLISEQDFVYVSIDSDYFEVTRLLLENQIQPEMVFIEGDFVTLIVDVSISSLVRELFTSTEVAYLSKKITCNIHSALDGVGLTQIISTTLAEHQIPCNIVAAYYHDHVFVEKEKADLAHKLLEKLKK
jgi:hypothetical protein